MINRVQFTVIGVLTERGQGLDVSNEDSQIYVPLSTAMRRLTNLDHYGGIVLEIDSLTGMDAAAEQSRSLLHQMHHIQPNQPEDFQIQNQKSLIDTQMASANRLSFFLRWIAASALAVSGLGIVAITWIAVKERTHEIGTRRGSCVCSTALAGALFHAIIGAILTNCNPVHGRRDVEDLPR